MSHANRIFAAVILSLLALRCSSAQDADGVSAEYLPLSHLVGNWHRETTAEVAEWTPKRATVAGGVNNIQWILGGRFLEDRGQNPDGSEHLGIWTYDAQKKMYRWWAFLAVGKVLAFEGKWDPTTKVLTGTADMGDGITAKVEYHIEGGDSYHWHMVATDSSGKTYVNVRAKMTRKKPTAAEQLREPEPPSRSN